MNLNSITCSIDPVVSGTKCEILCDAGYYHMGATSTTCLPNGLWSSTVPTCVYHVSWLWLL